MVRMEVFIDETGLEPRPGKLRAGEIDPLMLMHVKKDSANRKNQATGHVPKPNNPQGMSAHEKKQDP